MKTQRIVWLLLIAAVWLPPRCQAAPTNCAPAWFGSTLVDAESLFGWGIEQDTGAGGTFQIVPGWIGNAVQLTWSIGTGDWIQARYVFPSPIDWRSLKRATLRICRWKRSERVWVFPPRLPKDGWHGSERKHANSSRTN